MSASGQRPQPFGRRLVLVDFGWDDADLLPVLLRRPGISVRLVAGQRPEDPGVRLADLCDLPRTLDLADLTREIFALALVSERSPRRSQVESLLRAMGTPVQTPREFLGVETASQEPAAPESAFDFDAALAMQASRVDEALGDWGESESVSPEARIEQSPLAEAFAGPPGWLEPARFLARVERAAEHHAQRDLPLALDRIDLPRSAAADRFAEDLPARLRDSDSICRPTPFRVLLLSTSPRRFAPLRARLFGLWEAAWLATGNARPAADPVDQRIELTRAHEAAAFLATARLWSDPSRA